jgi:AbrB family looped-hinge helix DNA binding protein
MARATISTKFQVVIPREIREQAGITSGQTVEVLVKDGVITLVPHRPLAELRGALRGADTSELRDKSERL